MYRVKKADYLDQHGKEHYIIIGPDLFYCSGLTYNQAYGICDRLNELSAKAQKV